MAMGPMGGRGMRPAEKSKRGLRGVQRGEGRIQMEVCRV